MESFQNEVHNAIDILTKLFEENNIDFIIVGGTASFIHGYNRTTEDIDIIVSDLDKDKIKELVNLYSLESSKKESIKTHFRKVTLDCYCHINLYLEIIYTGDTFGDSKVPELNKFTRKGKHLISLKDLIVMKLEAGRFQDIADVSKLIEKNKLPKDFIDNDKYLQVWVNT